MPMTLGVGVAVMEPPTELIQRCLASQTHDIDRAIGPVFKVVYRRNTVDDNLGVTGSLQWLYERTEGEVVAFFHSDLEIKAPWVERILGEFSDLAVGVVGFGGATQLGDDDIYKTPYTLGQLVRKGYRSNTDDAEQHGKRFEGVCDVATLDGFCLVVRRSLLTSIGGWDYLFPFHNYDNALCVHARRLGYKVRMVGVRCQHHGGRTSTTAEAVAHWAAEGTTDQRIHTDSHRVLYELGRGILPIKVRC